MPITTKFTVKVQERRGTHVQCVSLLTSSPMRVMRSPVLLRLKQGLVQVLVVGVDASVFKVVFDAAAHHHQGLAHKEHEHALDEGQHEV